MAKKTKSPDSKIRTINIAGKLHLEPNKNYYSGPDRPNKPSRSPYYKKPSSELRQAVRAKLMTVGEAAETAALKRYYKQRGVVKKNFPGIVSKPLKTSDAYLKYKPYVPPSPIESQVRSMTRSRNAAVFSGVKSQNYDAFIKSLGKTSTASRKSTFKVETPKGTKRNLTFRYTAAEVAEKARSGEITQNRLRSWVLASTNRLQTRGAELAAEEAAVAKAELKAQNARGVQRRAKALERKKLYQSPETKRFREEKIKSRGTAVIHVAEKHGKITFPEYPKQKFIRVSEEAYRLSKEAEKIALKNKVAAQGQQSFAEALKNVESGANVETRRKVTVKELESAFENAQREATILERTKMPKAKVKAAGKKEPAKKGAKAQLVKPKGQLVKPKGKLAPTMENLAKVLGGEAPKAPAGKAKAPAKGKPAKAPKATVAAPKVEETKPKVRVKPTAAPAPKQEAPKGKAKAPKAAPAAAKPAPSVAKPAAVKPAVSKPVVVKPAVTAKPKPTVKPKPAAAAAKPTAAELAARGEARAAGVRQRAGEVALNRARGNMANRAAESAAKGGGSWKSRLFKAGLSVAGSLITAGTVGYMVGDRQESSVGQKPKPTGKPTTTKPTTTAAAAKKPTVQQVARDTRTATKVAPTSKLSGFGQAFKQARQARLAGTAGDTFQFGGKTYTSYQRGEQPRAAAPKAPTPVTTSYGDDSYRMHEAFRKEMESSMAKAQPSMSATQLEEQFKKKKGPR